MDRRNVFIYGIGDKSRISNLIAAIEKSGCDLFIGPSKEEHDFLYKNYDYYKKSYDMKIGSFCSDVGRLYILSIKKGLYIDTSVVVGEKFSDFYDRHIQNKVSLFREAPSSIASAVMFSGVENNDFYKEMLNQFANKIDYDPRLVPILPDIISSKLRLMKNIYSFDDMVINDIHIFSLLEIRNENELKKIGSLSGKANSKKIDMNSLKDDNVGAEGEILGKQGIDQKKGKRRQHEYILMAKYMSFPTPLTIRGVFDGSKTSSERAELTAVYKKLGYRVKFLDRLIGSKMLHAFSLKWLKTNNNK